MNIYPLGLMLALITAQYIWAKFPSFAWLLARPVGMVIITIALLGLLLILGAAVQLRLNHTTTNPTKTPKVLVQSGFFAYSRNPIYLGMLLLLAVVPLTAMQPRLWVFTLVFFLILNFVVIPSEERIMRGEFGASFTNYSQRVRRWLGRHSHPTP